MYCVASAAAVPVLQLQLQQLLPAPKVTQAGSPRRHWPATRCHAHSCVLLAACCQRQARPAVPSGAKSALDRGAAHSRRWAGFRPSLPAAHCN